MVKSHGPQAAHTVGALPGSCGMKQQSRAVHGSITTLLPDELLVYPLTIVICLGQGRGYQTTYTCMYSEFKSIIKFLHQESGQIWRSKSGLVSVCFFQLFNNVNKRGIYKAIPSNLLEVLTSL